MKHNQMRQVVFPILAAFIWGTAFVAQDMCADAIGAFAFNASRYFIAVLALLVVILVSLFEDRLNAWFAKKRLLPGTEHAAATFEEDGYVSATGVTESRFSYAQIVAVAETARYFVFALSSHHTQAYDKRTIRGGSVEDFRAFIAEKTGKLVENIK